MQAPLRARVTGNLVRLFKAAPFSNLEHGVFFCQEASDLKTYVS